MEVLKEVTAARDEAQAELIKAEVALIDATTRSVAAREGADRLEAAVAALSGESTAATVPKLPEFTETVNNEGTTTVERQAQADLSPEEFDKQRKRRQRKKEKEEIANNPLAHLKCAGCGQLGTLQEVMLEAPSGIPIRCMTCSKCGNQVF